MRVRRHTGDPLDPEVERGQGVAGLGHEADEEPSQARVHVQWQLVAQGQLGIEHRGGGEVGGKVVCEPWQNSTGVVISLTVRLRPQSSLTLATSSTGSIMP